LSQLLFDRFHDLQARYVLRRQTQPEHPALIPTQLARQALGTLPHPSSAADASPSRGTQRGQAPLIAIQAAAE